MEVGIVGEPLLPFVGLEAACERLEVHPCTEVPAGTRHDGHTNVGVAVDLQPGVVHADEHLARQGVALCRTVQRDDDDRDRVAREGDGVRSARSCDHTSSGRISASVPPSTTTIDPCITADSGESTKATTPAISAG